MPRRPVLDEIEHAFERQHRAADAQVAFQVVGAEATGQTLDSSDLRLQRAVKSARQLPARLREHPHLRDNWIPMRESPHWQSRIQVTMKFLPLIAALASLTTPLPAQNRNLELSLRLSQQAMSMNSSLAVVVTWRNLSGDHAVALRGEPGPSDSGGLEFVVMDANGSNRALTPFRGRLSAAEVAAGDRKVDLSPGHGHGISFRLTPRDLFPGPGRYQVGVRYASPLPSSGNPSVRAEVLEGARAESRLYEVEVLP